MEGIFFCRNVKTDTITLGQARGAVMAAVEMKGVPLYEYSPKKVKQAVVGFGAAHKDQVIKMVQSILGLTEAPTDDEADALALAICHINHCRSPLKGELKRI